MKKLFFLLFILCMGFAASAHKFYVSITNIDYNQESKSYEITFKLFTDDLEAALKVYAADDLFLGTDKEAKNADALIDRYLSNKFQLVLDNQPLESEYIGKEVEYDVVWCYMEVKDAKEQGTLQIRNAIFAELFQEQTNLIHLNRNGESKSEALHIGRLSTTFSE